jgi:ankyrin repeat protein
MGRTDLHYAALADDADQVRALIARGEDPDVADLQGFTPLHFAAQERATRAATALLDGGANVDLVNRHGNTPLWVAVFNARDDGSVIRLLRDRGADPAKPNVAGRTPLQLARTIANYPVAENFQDLP